MGCGSPTKPVQIGLGPAVLRDDCDSAPPWAGHAISKNAMKICANPIALESSWTGTKGSSQSRWWQRPATSGISRLRGRPFSSAAHKN